MQAFTAALKYNATVTEMDDTPSQDRQIRVAATIYFWALLLITVIYLMRWPIMAYDTDLWRYLNYGKHFFVQGEILHNSTYSFVSPQREFINYSWMFQNIVYGIYQVAGYFGLILFRTLVYLAIMLITFHFLARRNKNLLLPALVTAYTILLVDRCSDPRPYILSFLFIIIFLYILEFQVEKIWILPFVSLLWVNVHGIEYPVLVLICLAYATRLLLKRRFGKDSSSHRDMLQLAVLTVSMGMIFATPHGYNLISLPFSSTTYTASYVGEINPIKLQDLFTFRFSGFVPSYHTIYNIVIYTSCFLFIRNCFRKNIHISHVILFMGGLFLLTKGIRFIYEFSLLALPSLHGSESGVAKRRFFARPFPVSLCICTLLLLLSVLTLKSLMGNPPRYPVTAGDLPYGVAAFLKKIEKRGKILNNPASGGFIQWELSTQYKMYMDLHVPFFFTDEDFFTAATSIHNADCLAKFIQRYQPDFITMPRRHHHRSTITRFPTYNLVFFDDQEVLYVNSRTFPDVAKRHRIERIDPYSLETADIEHMKERHRSRMLAELLAMQQIYGHCSIVNQTIGKIALHEKNLETAMKTAESLMKDFPDTGVGYSLFGDVMLKQKRPSVALRYYRKADTKLADSKKPSLYRKMWICNTQIGQHKAAYHLMRKAVNIFSPQAGYLDLYKMAFSSLQIGRIEEAAMLCRFAEYKRPEGDTTWKKRIRRLQTQILSK